MRAKNTNAVLLKIEGAFDSKLAENITNHSLSVAMGYQNWNRTLQKRFDELVEQGRIKVSDKRTNGKGTRYNLQVVNPLTEKEKEELGYYDPEKNDKIIFDELPSTMEVQKKSFTWELSDARSISGFEEVQTSTDDITDLFDGLQSITKNIIIRMKDLEEKNKRLELELENSKSREKVWIAKTTELREMLYRR